LDLSGSYKDDDGNQVTKIPKAKPVLQNASTSPDYDTDAIFEDYKIESPISKFDEESVLSESFDCMENNLGYERGYKFDEEFVLSESFDFMENNLGYERGYKFDEESVLSESFDFTENNLGYERGYLTELNDIETDILEATDIYSYDEHNTQFRSNARGALIPFAAYKDGSSNACVKIADSATVNSKQTCTFHVKECNLPAKHTNDDVNAVVTNHSVHEAYNHSVGPWPWTDQFSEGSKPIDNDIQHLNWEEFIEIFKIP
jgi:hypothetical protein